MRGSRGTLLKALGGLLMAGMACSAEATISIVNNAPLVFGDLSVGATAGTVVITPAGARSTTGGVTGLPSTFAAASFTVSKGSGSNTYTIVLPGSITLTSGGGFTMTVNTFTSNPAGSGKANPTQTLTVGATLNVGANQKPGSYSGTFTVTVNQQ